MKDKAIPILNDYCLESGIYGIPAAAEEFDENEYRYLRITDVTDDGVLITTDAKSISDKDADKYLLSENDIVFARTGNSTGRTYFYDKRDGELVFAGFLIKYKLDPEKINPKYLKYFTISKQYKHWVDNFSTGSTRGNMSAQDFGGMPLVVPERGQQDLLVRVLDSITDKISLNNHINTELEAMAKTIYNYWFVQFDFPNEEGKPYKASGGEMKYNEELKREIPVGWDVNKLGKVSTVKAGGDKPKVYSIQKTEVCLIPIFSNGIDNEGLYGYTNEANIQKQSITVSARGTIGYCVLRNKPFVPIIRLIVVTPNLVESAKYFHEFLKSVEYVKNGSVQQQLTVPEISSWNIIIPQTEVLKEFDKITSTYVEKIDLIKKETQELITLRDFLLPLLMNGQVKVK